MIGIENVDYTGSIDAELLGDSNDNIFYSGTGSDLIDGRGGNDTFFQYGSSSDWTITYNATSGETTMTNGSEVDIIKNVENILFGTINTSHNINVDENIDPNILIYTAIPSDAGVTPNSYTLAGTDASLMNVNNSNGEVKFNLSQILKLKKIIILMFFFLTVITVKFKTYLFK